MRVPRWAPVLLPAVFWIGSVAVAAGSPPGPATGAPAVRGILEKRCLGCHGVGNRLGSLDLRSRASALKGGLRGPALAPGDPAGSLLWQMVSGARQPLMPPGGKLPAGEAEVLRRWIAEGAPWPGESLDEAAKQSWWSFRPVVRPKPPAERSPWVTNAVDAFVLRELRRQGLSPARPTHRRDLIRRAYLGVIGLPPTPEQVAAFEADRRHDAWRRVVDGLLDSPHYGERWARHWLDLVRYADSSGFEGDKDRPNAWRYRDYVIHAFNQDRPYDRFLREQLAGDELDHGNHELLIATGYLACGPQDQVQKDEQTRADELDDLVSTTGSAFLGLTLGCARCHDHKYDPVPQADYYRLQALFAPTERREVDIPTDEQRREVESHNAAVERELAPARGRLEELKRTARGRVAATEPKDDQLAAALMGPERVEWDGLQKRIREGEGRKRSFPQALCVTDRSPEWGPTHLLLRGDPHHKGPVVAPGFLTVLPGGDAEVARPASLTRTTGRRLALARWLTAPEHPLTPRVWVNRVWRQHFGRGIVNSPSNFGLNGELPSHPELLDWLAHRFVHDFGWRTKELHRLILMSSTYRQSSAGRPESQARDPQNRYYWRMPLRRLEAEAIRDSILAVSGALNSQMGGQPVYPPVDPTLRADTFLGINWPEGEDSPKTWRRSIYIKVKRSLLFPQLEVFDCPEITSTVPQRNSTTTPTQALLMLNDPLVRRQAALFAERLVREAGPAPERQLTRAYQLALGRDPAPTERAVGLKYLAAHPLQDLCHALFNLNEFLYSP